MCQFICFARSSHNDGWSQPQPTELAQPVRRARNADGVPRHDAEQREFMPFTILKHVHTTKSQRSGTANVISLFAAQRNSQRVWSCFYQSSSAPPSHVHSSTRAATHNFAHAPVVLRAAHTCATHAVLTAPPLIILTHATSSPPPPLAPVHSAARRRNHRSHSILLRDRRHHHVLQVPTRSPRKSELEEVRAATDAYPHLSLLDWPSVHAP